MRIIQGGMGVGISHWRLARAVALEGQLGVVSGTALDQVLARRLQQGDPGGHMRRALDHFPVPEFAEHVWHTYYIPGGKTEREPWRGVEMGSHEPTVTWQTLVVVANFVVYIDQTDFAEPLLSLGGRQLLDLCEQLRQPFQTAAKGLCDGVQAGCQTPLKDRARQGHGHTPSP